MQAALFWHETAGPVCCVSVRRPGLHGFAAVCGALPAFDRGGKSAMAGRPLFAMTEAGCIQRRERARQCQFIIPAGNNMRDGVSCPVDNLADVVVRGRVKVVHPGAITVVDIPDSISRVADGEPVTAEYWRRRG